MTNNEECLICGAPLQYLDHTETMECAICKQPSASNVRCANGHYVCDRCHTSGVESIVAVCQASESKNAVEIFERLVSMPFCYMHGPEHHIIVGAALLTAFHNAGGEANLRQALPEMVRRGKQVPGGACGNWGACGAAISAGIFAALATKSTPLATEAWRLSNLATAQALTSISQHGGPRCCKRDSYKALLSATAFAKNELGVAMKLTEPVCSRHMKNNQCLRGGCPFFPKDGQQ